MTRIAVRTVLALGTAVAAIAAPAAAFAHTGVGDASGFSHGFMHPFSGIDHILAMVSVGLLAARLGGRAVWLVPGSFVALMAVGGALGFFGVPLPQVETGIAASVIVLGLLIAAGVSLPTTAAMALVGFFAIFHGHAHGAEMPMDISAEGYGAGFILATALLHAIGVGAGLALGRIEGTAGRRLRQVGGAAVALVGAGLMVGAI